MKNSSAGIDSSNPFDFIDVIVIENLHQMPALIIHIDDEVALRQAFEHILIMVEETLDSLCRLPGMGSLSGVQVSDRFCSYGIVYRVKQIGADTQKNQRNKKTKFIFHLHGRTHLFSS